MPRIAHVISTPEGIGGAEVGLTSLLDAGREHGWDQAVLNPFAKRIDGGALANACRSVAPAATFEAHRCHSLRELPGTRAWLATQIAAGCFDIVHAHLFHAAVLVGSLCRQIDAATILTHHHGDHNVAEGRRLRVLADRHFGRQFDRVVAVSEWVRRFLIETYHYPKDLVEVIPNGWGGHPLAPRSHTGPTLVCVAHMREQKGHADLLRAFALVRAEVPSARLRLVGNGPLCHSLRDLAGDLDLGGAVQFEGAVDDVWPVLAESDVFVLASHYEPLGIAAMEAMAAGLPVVATNVGGLPELVKPQQNGVLVPPRSPHALAQALIDVLTSKNYASLRSNARSASAQWHASTMAARYIALYGRLTTQREASLS